MNTTIKTLAFGRTAGDGAKFVQTFKRDIDIQKKQWFKSFTVWASIIMFSLCLIPVVREVIRDAGLAVVQFQALVHFVLRFKTQGPIGFLKSELKGEL